MRRQVDEGMQYQNKLRHHPSYCSFLAVRVFIISEYALYLYKCHLFQFNAAHLKLYTSWLY